MLKKIMIVVGSLVAATISMSDDASAHRYFHSRHLGFAAHARHAGWARAASWGRAAWGRKAWSGHFTRPRFASHGYRHLAWHRMAPRRAMAAYQAAPSPLAGLFAAPGQIAAAPAVAAAAVAAPVTAPFVRAAASVAGRVQTGRASFYGGGGRTAAGGHVGAATCAHRFLPFGTRILVTNLANAHSAVLTVNDRGPFVAGRIVDVSVGAAGVLGMLHSGTAPVRVQVVGGRG